MADPEVPGWTPARARLDPACFERGRVGPYRLGPRLRATPLGEVSLALADGGESVLELHELGALAGSALAGPDGLLLADLAHVIGLRHRHLSTVVGAGIEGRSPYVVREHRLGRTLASVLDDGGPLDPGVGAAVLYAVAEGVAFLAEQGPSPGVACAGGFDAGEVFLGFDGGVTVLGAGLHRARPERGHPIARDLAACRALALTLDPGGALAALATHALDAADLAADLRRTHREACGRSAALVGAALRARCAEAIRADRDFFGLPTLH